jgi:hypothetical protein
MIEASGFKFDLGCVAHSSGTLATAKYFAVYSTGIAADGQPYVALCLTSTNGNNRALGVLQNNPAASEAAEVRLIGITKWATEAVVAAGAQVTCSTAGCALTATTTAHTVMGRALSASATTSGEIIDVLLLPNGTWFA